MRTCPIVIGALSWFAFAAWAQAAVLVVDKAGGPGVFTSPQLAFNAAVSGDIVLIHAGTYGMNPGFPFGSPPISAKSLTVVADPPGAAVKIGATQVSGLAANQVVIFRGIDFDGNDSGFLATDTDALTINACAGTVWIEDATIRGGQGGSASHLSIPARSGIVAGTAHVTLVRCVVDGGLPFPGDGINPSGTGGCGIQATNSVIAAFDSTFRGESPAAVPIIGLESGVGALLTKTSLMLSGCTVGGGVTGCATCGAAIKADAASAVTWISSSFSSGGPGPAIAAPAGIVSQWPGMARSFELASPVIEFHPVAVTMHGVAGDAVIAFWSPLGAYVPLAVPGWLVIAPPVFGPFALGTITAPGGELSYSVNAPALVPTSIDGFTFLMQPFFVNGAEAIAGSPSAFTLLR